MSFGEHWLPTTQILQPRATAAEEEVYQIVEGACLKNLEKLAPEQRLPRLITVESHRLLQAVYGFPISTGLGLVFGESEEWLELEE